MTAKGKHTDWLPAGWHRVDTRIIGIPRLRPEQRCRVTHVCGRGAPMTGSGRPQDDGSEPNADPTRTRLELGCRKSLK